jgi:hypothetical protein
VIAGTRFLELRYVEACSRIACAFVPPYPNELIEARRIPFSVYHG